MPKRQKEKPSKIGSAPLARARSRENSKTAGSSIPQKIASTLASLLTDGDLADVVAVYRDGLRATQRIWVEEGTVDERGRRRGRWEHCPDYRVRKACADMIAAYKEGLPVQRQEILVQKFQSADQIIERLRSSPEALRAIMGAGVKIEVAGEVIEGEFTPVQESGSENGSVASEENES